jgi:hypothetical protein
VPNSRALTAVLALLLAGLYASEWLKRDPRRGDYAAFYTAGKLYREGRPVYDLDSQCEIQRQIGTPLCLPFYHPPVLLPLMSLTAGPDYLTSFRLWSALMFALILLAAWPLYGLTGDAVKALALATFYPAFLSVAQGQDTALVLLGVCLWALMLSKGRDVLAGLCLSLACVKPHLALALALPLLFARPRAFLGFAAGGSAMVLWSLLLVGPEGFAGLLRLTTLSAEGDGFGIHHAAMYNLAGLLARAGLGVWWAWPAYVAAVAGVAVLWRRRGVDTSLGVLAAVFFAPHLHGHDLSLLIIPLATLPAIAAPLISAALRVSIAVGIGHPFAYALMLGLAAHAIVRDGKKAARSAPTASRLPELNS